MLPIEAIWTHLKVVHESHTLGFNTRRSVDSSKGTFDAFIQNLLQQREMFTFSTLEYIEELSQVMDQYDGVDFTFRYKEPSSIRANLENQTIRKPLNKALNDVLGLRFIINCDTETLKEIAAKLEASHPSTMGRVTLVDQTGGKRNDDGYKGIHLYSKFDNFSFPVEIQLWTRVHALLNEYLHDNIYKMGYTEGELDVHALDLRDWLESVPVLPDDFEITSYVDFLYERKDMRKGENDE